MKAFLKNFEILSIAWFFARHNFGMFSIVVSFSVVGGLLEGFGLSLFMPMLINSSNHDQVGKVVSALMSAFGISTQLQASLFVLIGVFLMRNVARFYELHFKSRFEQSFIFSAQTSVMDGIFRMNYSDYFRRFAPNGTSLLTSDIVVLSQVIQHVLVFVVSMSAGFALAIAALLINPWATFFGLIFGGVLFVALKWANKKTREVSIRLTDSTRDFINRVQEVFEQYRYLRSTNQFPRIKQKVLQEAKSRHEGMVQVQTGNGFMMSLNQFLAILFLSGVIYFAVEVREQPVARVVVSIAIMYRIISMLTQAFGSVHVVTSLVGSYYMVRENLELITSSREREGTTALTRLKNEVRFENVEYIEDKVKLIDHVSFTIKKGEYVGLLGRTGAGKTLLTQLLTGLIFPTSGRVLIDGTDIENVQLSSWRSRIGFVPQDFSLFTGTVRESICGESLLESEEERTRFDRVVRQANLREVIANLPKGLETLVGKGGHPLSGGQKQRLVIARELFRDPEILILDEATNALDASTQESIARVIESIRGEVTIIMIAHRLRMVENADHLIILDQGRVIRDGGPEVLEAYQAEQSQDSEEGSERRPAPRLWVGVREDIVLTLPGISPDPLRVTDLSISGLSFFGDEKWLLSKDSKESYTGTLMIGGKSYSLAVRPVRYAAGRLGGPLIEPSVLLSDAIQNFVMESFVVDVRKTG